MEEKNEGVAIATMAFQKLIERTSVEQGIFLEEELTLTDSHSDRFSKQIK
jgi:hypothetical protein